MRNPPLLGAAANQMWQEVVALVLELTAWSQMLALSVHPARTWEPKRLRLRILFTAGRLARGGRRTRLRPSNRWPWTDLIITTRLMNGISSQAEQSGLRPMRGMARGVLLARGYFLGCYGGVEEVGDEVLRYGVAVKSGRSYDCG